MTLLAAAVCVVGAYLAVRPPGLDAMVVQELSGRYAFSAVRIETEGAPKESRFRNVHPEVAHIEGWISAFGAGVAIADLDGDGLAGELCQVDPRTDEVILRSLAAPQTQQFVLWSPDSAQDLHFAPMGCLPADLNEDGATDLLVYFWGHGPVLFIRAAPPRPTYRQMGSEAHPSERGGRWLQGGDFVVVPLTVGAEPWFTSAAVVVDLNGDGHLDLVLGNYFADGSSVLSPHAQSSPEMPDSMSNAQNGGSKRFLLWVGVESGVPRFDPVDGLLGPEEAHGWTLAIGAQDLDGDLLPELYFANDFGPDVLLRNSSTPSRLVFERVVGEWSPITPRSRVLGKDSYKGMGVEFGDLDSDGLIDIWVSNISEEYALFEAHLAWIRTERSWQRSFPFSERSEALGLARSGWGWDVKLADFDNDGQVEGVQATGFLSGETSRWSELQELATASDLLVRHPSWWPRFSRGDGLSAAARLHFFVKVGERFYDFAESVGLGAPQISRGMAVGDIDGDGDVDLVVANQWQDSMLYRNESPSSGKSLIVRPILPRASIGNAIQLESGDLPGPPAVGAEVSVMLDSGELMVAQVDGGNGHSGRRAPEVHFGLGSRLPLEVRIRWRDRSGVVQERALSGFGPGRYTALLGTDGGLQ